MGSDDATENASNKPTDSLKRQIEELVSGHRHRKPTSLREFVDQKMTEERRKTPADDSDSTK
jgi:hypothetical protein